MRAPHVALALTLVAPASLHAQVRAVTPPPRVSFAALRDNDGLRVGREVVRSERPIQLPRIVAAGEGWGFVWSESEGDAQLEVFAAHLDAGLVPMRRVAVSPLDGSLGAFAFAAPLDHDVWGVVFDDDRSARASWFARVDFSEHAATHRAPLLTAEGTPTTPALAWNPRRHTFAVMTHADGSLAVHLVDAVGRVTTPHAWRFARARTLTLATSPLVATAQGWALAMVRDDRLVVARLDAPGDPALVDVASANHHLNGLALDDDGDGLGVAWSVYDQGVYFTRIDGVRTPTEARRLSTAPFANNPALAWNGTHHVVAWSEQEGAIPSVRVQRVDRAMRPLPACTVAVGSVGREMWFHHLAAGGRDGRDVGLSWQVGQSRAMAMVLAP